MTIPTGRFVWFEHISKDPKKAQGFLGELFNWKSESMTMPNGAPYTMIKCGDHQIGGIVEPPPQAPPHAYWLSHLQVANAQTTANQIKSLGGKIIREPIAMGDFGTMGIVADPFGGVFALWQPNKPEGEGDFRGHANDWCWNELVTDDPDRSVEFYKAIGGFDGVDKMDMGQGTYSVLKSTGKGRAGVVKSFMPGAPQAWLPYVQVASADQTHEKAKRLGASIKMPPTDIPTVGRFSVFTDPLGAALGVLQPAPA